MVTVNVKSDDSITKSATRVVGLPVDDARGFCWLLPPFQTNLESNLQFPSGGALLQVQKPMMHILNTTPGAAHVYELESYARRCDLEVLVEHRKKMVSSVLFPVQLA